MIYLPRGKQSLQSFLQLRGDLALASLLFADEAPDEPCSAYCFIAKEPELNQRLLMTQIHELVCPK